MKNSRWLLVVVLVMLIGVFPALAQDTSGDDYTKRYEGIPFERLEDGGFVLGDPDAPITIVEFADFLCPHCQDYQETAHQLIEELVATGEVRFEYRLFPVVDPNYSPYSAALAECADEQVPGLFWATHDLLYDLGKARDIGPDTAETVASTFDLELTRLTLCAENADQYMIDQELGRSLGVTGTPATRIRLSTGEIGIPTLNGETFPRGGVPLSILTQIVELEDLSTAVTIPVQPLAELVEGDALCEGVEAACWNGLIMGESAWEDVVAQIQSNPQFADVQVVDDPSSEANVIGWHFLLGNISDFSQAVTLDGETLEYVSLIELSPFNVGEVFENLGEPVSAIVNVGDDENSFVSLFYPERALIVQVYVRVSEGGFSEVSQVIGAQYVTVARMDELITNFTPVEWAGFEGYETYIK